MKRNGCGKSSEQDLGEFTSRKNRFYQWCLPERITVLENIALESKNENERKQLTDLAPLRVFLARKAIVKKWYNEC